VSSQKISEGGVAALLAAVDPFHDKPIEHLRGWPDLETGPSTIRHFKQSSTIKAIDDGSSIMIFSHPILNVQTCLSTTRRNSVIDTVTNGVSTNFTIAPTSIYSLDAAQSQSAILPIAGTVQTSHSIPANYFGDGPCRLIGHGIEVHDVTAEIQKQGTLTVFEVPQNVADREAILVRAQTVNAQSYGQTNQDICNLMRFPSSLAQIMTYPSTQQWEAKEGAYVVIPFSGHENPALQAGYRTPFVNTAPSSVIDLPTAVNTSARAIGTYASGGVAGEPFIFLANQFAPMHSRGIYLTGLNANPTYTITTNFFFESFPYAESELVSLARPSCPFDPKALALISIIMQQLPVGCPVNENPLGEWFWEAVETALPFLGGAASALFPLATPLIASAQSSASKYAAKQVKQYKKQELDRKQRKAAVKNEVRQLVKNDVANQQAVREGRAKNK